MCRVHDRQRRSGCIEYRAVKTPVEDTLSGSMKTAATVRNRILAGLPRGEYARILPSLTRVTLKSGQVLHEPGGSTPSAYFLDSAIVSIVSLAQDGTSMEVSLVGDEGVVGLPIVLRSHGLPYRIIVQAPGVAWRIKADVLRREFERCGLLHELVLRYVHTLIVYLSQSSACNRFHTIQQRLSRWLLISQDRARSSEIRSTQEFLSQILGVNRGSASQAASALQRAGLIRYRRGQIAILDRRGLEAAACECYRVVRGEFDRLFRE